MHYLVVLVLFVVLGISPSWATTRYIDPMLVLNCTSGNYSLVNRDCTGSDGNAYLTIEAGKQVTQAGDTLYLRGGTYPTTQRINLQEPTVKTGTATAWITIAGYPGERPVLQYADTIVDGYGPIKARGNIAYIRFENMTLDGVNATSGTRWQIRDGNHHFILQDLEIKNFPGSLLIVADNVSVLNCDIHDAKSASGTYYGIYFSAGVNGLIDGNHIYSNNGGGIHAFPGPISNLVIRNNRVHHNNYAASGSVPGILVYEDVDYNSGAAIIDGVDVYNNVVYENGVDKPSGTAGGIRVANGAANVRVLNNTVYGNNGYGISVHADGNGPPVNTTVQNNITTNNIGDDYANTGTNTTVGYNACTSAEPCGSTGKVTLSSSTACFVDAANDDYRLKQGTNPCRNAGTSVSTRPAPVGGVDIGAYEQGVITSAAMVGGYLELTVSVMTPGVLPASAISGITVACGGGAPCVGSPVAASANVKSGSNNVIQVALSGIGTPGTGTVSMAATNATDSLFVGGSGGTAQGLNSISAMSIVGDLANTTGAGVPVATWSRFPLTEGSGTVANDATGNGNHGTVSTGVTWVADTSGTGVAIPTDATYRHISTTYGSGVNPSTQDFTVCALVRPTLTGNAQKVVFSSGSNGVSQRWYVGWYPVSGQTQWGIGIQASGMQTGSEFIATETMSLVCMVNDSTADTATLWVNGVKGTVAGKSVKTLTSYSLAGNVRAGNDGTFTLNNGGFTVYDLLVWNTKASDADLIALYEAISPSGTSAGYAQSHVQWQHIYTTSGLAPVVLTANGDGSIDVVANGGIAPVVQYTCTGGDCANISPRLYYSTDGTNFDLPVPQTIGVAGIAAWGESTDVYFNDGGVAGCVNATGLTPNAGVTNLASVAGQTFALAQDHCRADRYPLRFGNVPNTSFWILVKTDSGQDLATYSATIKVNVIPMQANLGF